MPLPVTYSKKLDTPATSPDDDLLPCQTLPGYRQELGACEAFLP